MTNKGQRIENANILVALNNDETPLNQQVTTITKGYKGETTIVSTDPRVIKELMFDNNFLKKYIILRQEKKSGLLEDIKIIGGILKEEKGKWLNYVGKVIKTITEIKQNTKSLDDNRGELNDYM